MITAGSPVDYEVTGMEAEDVSGTPTNTAAVSSATNAPSLDNNSASDSILFRSSDLFTLESGCKAEVP